MRRLFVAQRLTNGAAGSVVGASPTVSGADSAKSYTVNVKAKTGGGASAWTNSAPATK